MQNWRYIFCKNMPYEEDILVRLVSAREAHPESCKLLRKRQFKHT